MSKQNYITLWRIPVECAEEIKNALEISCKNAINNGHYDIAESIIETLKDLNKEVSGGGDDE